MAILMSVRARMGILAAVGGVALAAGQTPAADAEAGPEWPNWRGADWDGIVKTATWNPAKLEGIQAAWKIDVGEGYSSMAIKDGRLYTLGNKSDQDVVFCADAASGAEVWTYRYPCAKGSYPGPRSTPTADGDRVYTFGREGHILCLQAADGKKVWERNAKSEFGAKNVGWGFSSSPRVEGDVLFVNAGKHGLALNKKTGEKLWESGAGPGGYSTPVVYEAGKKPAVALFGQKALIAVDFKTGQALWTLPWETSYDVNAADPIVSGGRMFVSSGYGRGCALVGADGAVVWQNKVMRNHFSTCVLLDGFLYGIDGNAGGGDLVCLEFATGTEKWRRTLGFGSLIAIGKRLLVLNERGDLFVVEADPAAYREVAAARGVLPKTCWTPPAFSAGRIYCRNHAGTVVCLDVRK